MVFSSIIILVKHLVFSGKHRFLGHEVEDAVVPAGVVAVYLADGADGRIIKACFVCNLLY